MSAEEEQFMEGEPPYMDDYEDMPLDPNQLEFEMPIRTDTQLANKVISSHAKNKLTYLVPVLKSEIVAIPLLDEHRHIVYKRVRVNGKIMSLPIIRKLARLNTIDHFDKKEEDFLIPDWFNHSIPSSILSEEEAALIRLLDDAGLVLARKILVNPSKIDAMGALHRLYVMKMSIAESAKGIKGGAIDKASTTTRKSESLNRMDQRELDDFKDRQQNGDRGMLGLGFQVPLIGIRI